MKKIIIILFCTAVTQAMQYDDRDHCAVLKAAALKNYIQEASYFIIHRQKTCEKFWVKSTYCLVSSCPEHYNPYHEQYSPQMVEELSKQSSAVVFYGRDDKWRGQMTILQGYIGSLACDQLRDMLDPNAKPIVSRAKIDNEWCNPYVSFFDKKNQFVFKMPLYGYFDGVQLSGDDKMCAEEQVEFSDDFSIEDRRKKRSSFCCALV